MLLLPLPPEDLRDFRSFHTTYLLLQKVSITLDLYLTHLLRSVKKAAIAIQLNIQVVPNKSLQN